MIRFVGFAKRIGGFGISTALSAVSSVATVPLLMRTVGAEAWAEMAVGISVGTILGIITGWGWGVLGPSIVAMTDSEEHRVSIYAESLLPRLLLGFVCLGLTWLACAAIGGRFWMASALMGMSVALYGLAAPWFFVGSGRPRDLFLYDTLPRVVGSVGGAAVCFLFPSPVLYAFVQILSVLVVILSSTRCICHNPRQLHLGRFSDALRRLASNRSAVGMSLIASLFFAFPLILVGAIEPSAKLEFALADRIQKWSNTGASPVVQTLQGWIPSGGRVRSRARKGLFSAFLVAASGSAFLCLLGGRLAILMSQNSVSISWGTQSAMAIIFGCVLVSNVSGAGVLAALGESRGMLVSTLFGALIGLALIVPLLIAFGAAGAMWAVAVSQVLVVLVQLELVRRSLDGRC